MDTPNCKTTKSFVSQSEVESVTETNHQNRRKCRVLYIMITVTPSQTNCTISLQNFRKNR